MQVAVGDYVRVRAGEYTVNCVELPESTLLVVPFGGVRKETPGFRINNSKVEIDLIQEFPEDFTPVVSFDCGTVPFDPSQSSLMGEEVETHELGVFRPNLTDRKVGKVPMHMVIDGFPKALKHVAEVMAWARDVKGYKLHDWRNLPEADVAFPSAAYRHMTENSIQKSDGLKALDRVDHESSKLHIAHQVFNLLGELELILGGKIE